ncbi:hypothetical protein GOODEAATRI_026907, partial [Goodea atripinnis]
YVTYLCVVHNRICGKMSHQMQRYRNGNIGPQEEWGNEHNPQAQCHPPPVNFFQGEIQRLSALLEMEREKWFKENQKVAYLQTELAETQFQWRRQKSLKEMYINKEKETKSKLERIDRFSDPATLDPAVIASKVHNDMKYKKKKLLQKDFEELKVALILNQEAFTSQIQAEKEKNNVLQEELDKLKTSYEELRSKCEVDVAAGRQEAQVQKFCEEKIGEDPQLLEKLRAAKDDLHQKMSQEIAFLQEKERGLQRELDQIKVSYQELNCKHEKEVSALKQQADTYQQEINREKNANLERANKDLQPNNPNAEKDDLHQKMSQEIVFLKEKEEYLESELEQVKDFHQELLGVYERDVAKLKEEVETYQKELNRVKTANSNRAMKDFQLINKLRDDNTYLYSTKSEKIEILQQQLEETENHLDQNEKDNSALRQQVKNFQQQIIQEKKAHLETAKMDLTLLNSMRTEQDDLKENMSKVIAFLQERENGFQRELDQIKVSYQELNCKCEKEVSALKQQADTYLKHLDREKKANSQRANKDLQLINKLRDEKVHLQKTLLEYIEILQQKSEEPENDNSELRKQVENLQLQIIQEKKGHLETAKKDLTLLNSMRTEQDNLRETMSKEIAFWQGKEKRLKGEMDKIEILYQELQSRYKTDVSALKQQAETFKKEINKNLKTANKNLELINNLQ